ncbi:unnamed protein product [Linum trigynum]|uniref:Uncharacterized protein n=1 Tax=Linum trigynum TaxID=586398 RepID=A0AAV2EZB3_9ROSI
MVDKMGALFDKRRSLKLEDYTLRAELNVPKGIDSAGIVARVAEINERIQEVDRKRRDKHALHCKPQLLDEIDQLNAELTVLMGKVDGSDPRKSLLMINPEH